MFKKVKTINSTDKYHDITDSYLQEANAFFQKMKARGELDTKLYLRHIVASYMFGYLNEKEFTDELKSYAPSDEPNIVPDYLFMVGIYTYEEYEKSILKNNLRKSIESINKVDEFVEMYNDTEERIHKNYERKVNELEFRLGKVDFIDYEIRDSDLKDEPYAKVFFVPSKENTSQLEVDVRFNSLFLEKLAEREDFNSMRDSEGNIKEDLIIEEWFQTAIIVMAANMLKESDIDFFRSIASDNPGSELVQRLEFDRDGIPEDTREEVEEFIKNKSVYK